MFLFSAGPKPCFKIGSTVLPRTENYCFNVKASYSQARWQFLNDYVPFAS